MEKNTYCVTVGEEKRSYEEGTSYQVIARDFQKDYPHDIVLAFVDGRLQELHKTLQADCAVEFETTGGSAGHKTYKRSMSLLLVKAIYDVAPREAIGKVRIHYSVSKGYYCTIKGDVTPDQAFLERVEARMRQMVEEDLPIRKRSVHTDEAIQMFHKHGMYDKERLFEYRRVSKVNIYSLNEFEDYYYGYMVPSAGYLKYFKLYPYDEGFVLQMPEMSEPEVVPPFEPQNKLFQVLKESTRWGDMQGIETVGALNDKITGGDATELVLVQEALQESRIGAIAEEIASRPHVKFVMIAGPSSSGKTTFSHRLSIQLKARGFKPHPIDDVVHFHNTHGGDRIQAAGGWEIIAVPADHDKREESLVYICKKGGKTVFYGHDTGVNLSEAAWALLAAERFDLVSLDATMGQKTIGGYPMGLPDIEPFLAKMEALGCVDGKTVKVINHFSHNGNMTQEDLERWGAERGILAAYDGMEVTF